VEPASVIPPGYSGLEMTNTELGDLVEYALFRRLGWTPLVGDAAGKVRQGPFDMIDENGVYVEVKAMTVFAKEYKIKMSSHAMTAKVLKAEGAVGTVIVVVERRPSGKLRGWVYRRSGLGNYRLGDDGSAWEFVGKVKI
jgi:hypothetical protein